MSGVPKSAYFLGHVSYAAIANLDMREAIFAYFFLTPPGRGSYFFIFDFLIK